jgi:alpha-amylase/alpha-mannosidase (GH57 family)
MSWQQMVYLPHIARHQNEEIVVIVRDRDLSNAQESGCEVDWFLQEVAQRTAGVEHPLVTTCSDGDNGGWFRNTTHGANFWSAFHDPLMTRVHSHPAGLRPRFIHEYLDEYGVHGEVQVRPGAWNTGWHHGVGFLQWTGSHAQREALARIHALSSKMHAARCGELGELTQHRLYHIEEARWLILRAQTSCNLYWGEAWVHRCHADLDAAQDHLTLAR